MDDVQSGFWVIDYTERVVRILSPLLMASYSQYRLWYGSPTVIRFVHELDMNMELPLGSAANVRDLLEMLDVIESTRFEALPSSWNKRVSWSID